MISAALLALASLTAAVPAPAAYAGETISAMKGHPALPARAATAKSGAPVACHPEPTKGRACRHHIVQAEQAKRQAAVLRADAGTSAINAQ
jgi:hypothetical protein